MSQYVILIRSVNTFDLEPGNPDYVYALTTSNHPPTGLTMLQNYCPVKLETIHYIRAGNGTDNLLLTLRIKFQDRQLHSFWYAFSTEDVTFIKSLNESNFNSMIGLIQRQLKKPEMDQAQTQEFINEQLKKAESALR